MKRLIEAIEDWMVNYKRNTIKPSSYDRLRVSAILMSKHPVSDIPIDELTSDDLQEYVNELVDDGYALTTIRKQMHLISAYITYANLKGDILRPIHKGVGLPSESMVKKRKKEVVAYDKDEQKRLKEVFYTGESPIYYADILMMETGLRAGEALALGWNDIDWRRRAISINKTVVRLGDSKRSYVQNSAKSFTSNRVIPLSSEAYNLLESMRRNDKSSSAFVFHDKLGKNLSYEVARWWTKKACGKAEVPYYGQHVFRHTFATNCYEKGCDVKLLSKMLGHSDVTITYNVYIHLFGDALEEMRLIVG